MKNPSPKRRFGLFALDVTVAVVAVALVSVGVYYANRDDGTCKAPGAEHVLELKNDTFSSENITVKRCDTVKVVNLDTQKYLLAFGVHDKHIAYPGYNEQTISPNEFFVIDMIQAGEFRLHDHLRDKAHINFTIQEN